MGKIIALHRTCSCCLFWVPELVPHTRLKVNAVRAVMKYSQEPGDSMRRYSAGAVVP